MPDTSTHPLGDIAGDSADAKSIVDSVLDLDAFLSGDVRLAEHVFTFCTEPDREALCDALEIELNDLTDAQGRPLTGLAVDAAVGDGGGRTAQQVAAELLAAREAYRKACRSIRVRQLNADDWGVWETKHRTAIADGDPYPPEVFESLIVACASLPRFTLEEVRKFRARVGMPVYLELGRAAYRVNTNAGVSLPKSQLSSVATRLIPPASS